jgi:DNA polymerase I-like protein with 3'-5' exonuclease and polymerase domains
MVDTARLSTRSQINFLIFQQIKQLDIVFKLNQRNVIVCDYSGQENVVAADLSGDAAMTKSVLEGADLHCLLAKFPEIADLTDDEIVKGQKKKKCIKST